MNRIKLFSNNELGIQVRTILNEDGSISINAEDTAIGFGWTQEKNGKKYVRWETLSGYCVEFGFSQDVGKDDFIPESLYYMLGMKAGNERALKYQKWLAMDVLPSIRKHGMYATDELVNNPDLLIEVATALKAEREKNKFLITQVDEQQEIIQRQQPKVTYYDLVLQCTDLLSVTEIAKDYGKSAKWLNTYLRDKHIQFLQGTGKHARWYLYAKYAEMGYAQSKTHPYTDSYGNPQTSTHLYWTQKGRYFIYETLKMDGIVPIIERN